MDTIETLLSENRRFSASDDFKKNAAITDGGIYQTADQDRLAFWETKANDLTWFQKWHTVLNWNRPYAEWFVGGTLNASYNCLDVHLSTHRSTKPAIIWEGEEGDIKTYTYHHLHTEVCKLANVLTQKGVQKGDRVTVYMPMIPELAIGVLACARIGAIHSVVFGGFSANSLKDRLIDSGSRLILTANAGSRRGKHLPIKDIVDQAIAGGDTQVTTVIVVSHINSYHATMSSIDYNYDDLMRHASADHDAVAMDSEDPLFILYTSGTTGKPKGIMHTTGGYLTHAKYSTKAVFDINDDDIYWCTADIGWITGHTYVIYGPLSNGATCLMFEGTPDYPAQDRFWQLIDRHKVTILYTAPTAIRSFMKWGNHLPAQHQLSSLRLLGSVGEPINPEAWIWYYTHIGHQKCPIVDTWWQTETGGIMISNLPALNDMKPGYTGLPLPGIKIEILDTNGHPITKGGGLLSITHPWPSMLRGVWGDQKRYSDTYWSRFDTYFAGDGATIDDDGYVMVLGRVDDVVNVAGHRIGTMEVESALVDCPSVSEAAVVGMPDDIKGQAIVAFVIIEDGTAPSPQLERELISQVGDKIGAIAKPKRIVFTQELPKTRSGKIMRRLLKNIVEGQPLGDATTLANPDAIVHIQQAFNNPV